MKQITIKQFIEKHPEFNQRVLQRVLQSGDKTVLLNRYGIKQATKLGTVYLLTVDNRKKPNKEYPISQTIERKPHKPHKPREKKPKLKEGDIIIAMYKKNPLKQYTVHRTTAKYAYSGGTKFSVQPNQDMRVRAYNAPETGLKYVVQKNIS